MQGSCSEFAPEWASQALCNPFGVSPKIDAPFISQFIFQWAWIILVFSVTWFFLGGLWEIATKKLWHLIFASSERRNSAAIELSDFKTNAVTDRFRHKALRRSRTWTPYRYSFEEKDPSAARQPIAIVLYRLAINSASLLTRPLGLIPAALALGIVTIQQGQFNFDFADWIQERPLAQITAFVGAAGLAIASINFISSRRSPRTRGFIKWKIDEIANEYNALDGVRNDAQELMKKLKSSINDWHALCFPTYGFPLQDSSNQIRESVPDRFRRVHAEIDKIANKIPSPFAFSNEVWRSLPLDTRDFIVELGLTSSPGTLMIRGSSRTRV